MGAVDHTDLLERVGGSQELLAEIIELFLEDGPQLLTRIQEALVRGDADEVRRAAHALKGSAGSFGAAALVSVAHQLETDAAAGSLDATAERLAVLLETELEQLSVELANLGNRRASGSPVGGFLDTLNGSAMPRRER